MEKKPPANAGDTRVRSLGWQNPLEQGMVTGSSILSCPWIPRTEESAGYSPQSHTKSDTTEAIQHAHMQTYKKIDPEGIFQDYLLLLTAHRPITADQENRLHIFLLTTFLRIESLQCLEDPTCNIFLFLLRFIFYFISSNLSEDRDQLLPNRLVLLSHASAFLIARNQISQTFFINSNFQSINQVPWSTLDLLQDLHTLLKMQRPVLDMSEIIQGSGNMGVMNYLNAAVGKN